jgi:hypothetical protein
MSGFEEIAVAYASIIDLPLCEQVGVWDTALLRYEQYRRYGELQ